MPRKTSFSEEYGEFKGSTSTKLEIIFGELKDFKKYTYEQLDQLNKDVGDLKGFKMWTLGFGAAAGFIAGFFKDLIFRKG